ncbi:MAG: methionine--tRNA ligase [Candidatus Marinimicrobia bacterium]|nr:methionine--tRNA ligase [Candidatus Neomarinimicrobiota bacterium]
MKNNFYVTTPLYYVNAEPHIGSLYTTVLADILASYHRMKNDDVFFLTGTDEHGQKVQQASEKNNITPQEHCDKYSEKFREIWKEINLKNDDFIRTTEERHEKVVKKILTDLFEKGEIYKDKYEGWYSVSEELFITEKEFEEGKFRDVKKISEVNYYFKMSKYQDQLIKYINDNPKFIQPENRRNEVLGFLKQPLRDLCISRPKSRLSWGIELPFDKDYVTYVWFDALINYISAIKYSEDDEFFNKQWPAIHLIGKDILTTHCVYWPTMLMAMRVEMPKTIFAHGWWMSEGKKMSKSLGNFIDLDTIREYFENVGIGAFNYFIMKNGPLFSDSDFSKRRFYEVYNSDLANDLGNMVNRIFKLINKYFEGKIPDSLELGERENKLKLNSETLTEEVFEELENFRIDEMLNKIIAFVSSINKYLEQEEPWKVAKINLERAGTVLFSALASLRVATGLLYPVMPTKIDKFLEVLNNGDKSETILEWSELKSGTEIGKIKALFPRIDISRI